VLHLSFYLSVCVFLSLCLCVCLSIYLSVCQSIYLSVNPSICLSIYLSVCQSVCLSVNLSICLSVCLSIYLSVCQSVCLSLLYHFFSGSDPSPVSQTWMYVCDIILCITKPFYLFFSKLIMFILTPLLQTAWPQFIQSYNLKKDCLYFRQIRVTI